MKLYYSPISPYSHKVLIAFEEKGVAVETERVNLGDPAARAEYEKINRFGKVPFLRDEARDWRVPESSIIIEYIDRHVPGGPRLLPDDPDLNRQARFHDRVIDLYITEQVLKIFFDGRRAADKKDPYGVEQAEKRADKTYALYNDLFAKKQFCLGDTFSLADIAAAAGLNVARQIRPFDAHPHLQAYANRLFERPAVAKVLERMRVERGA